MSSRVERALENHKKGYNCSQAVACAFADLADADENFVFAAAEGMGAGMGGMESTCGAVSGACMAAGLVNSSRDTEKPVTKAETYRLSKAIVQAFREKNHTLVCKELKGVKDGQPLRSCDGCIEDAARILEQVLEVSGKKEKR